MGSFGVVPAVAQAAGTSSVPSSMWSTDGMVTSVLPVGKLLYVGGRFTHVGPYTGGGVPVGRASGLPVARFPKVDGSVYAAVPDGHGGYYVGGQFSVVGGVARANLAHVRADGSVDPVWNPRASAWVSALALSGSTVYAGGEFRSIGGRARNRIAALDARTGRVTGWNPGANGAVDAVAVSGPTVYAGGEFRSIAGRARSYIAALNARTGRVTAWNPNASGNAAGYFGVSTLVVSGSTVYAGGNFTSIGGHARHYIAALNARTGSATAWNPNADSPVKAALRA